MINTMNGEPGGNGKTMTISPLSPEAFANPGAAWRGKPFWSWNGKLEKDELIRQIHILKEMGMGGYFMHSRTGLVTEYLGKEWFELINACAAEGDRLGMENWLYDEDRWPSGTAGGMVTANPDFRMKFIHMEKLEGAAFDLASWAQSKERPLGAWSCRLQNEIDIFDVKPVLSGTSKSDLAGKTVLAFQIIPMANGSFYNGNTYVDTLKREATEEYLRLTHEAYKTHCGHHFGKSIKGIFTDEPHRGPFMSGFGVPPSPGIDLTCLVPWTDTIFEAFAGMHQSRVEDQLPALFLRPDGRERIPVKAQYADTLLVLFLDNFAKPYLDWCNRNNLMVTGHVLHENSLACQVSTHGSVQRYYPLMHIPGIDYLCEHGREYWVAKQVDSTARQFRQPWILSELYGCTGWQMNFESHKAIGAWQALFGINLRCHHLSWYTMAGEAKRDYPASILHQSPWYKEYNTVETWFARLGYFRAQGETCCDLLVLNPVESVWGRVYPGAIKGMSAGDPGIRQLEKTYAECFAMLAGNHIDFDYGDEALLAEHGTCVIEKGKARLRLGAMQYSTVLIAGVETVRPSTLALLKDFLAAGGRVIVAGKAPSHVDSIPSDAFQTLPVISCSFEEEPLLRAVRMQEPQAIRIVYRPSGETARDVFCQLRKAQEGLCLTVLNMNRDKAHDIEVTLEGGEGSIIEEWDLETGDAGRHPASAQGRTVTFTTTLHTSQARCFRLVGKSSLPLKPEREEAWSDGLTVRLGQPTRITLAEPNICVLDVPSWSLNDGPENPVNDILQVDRKVRQQLGVPLRSGDMVQPWFRHAESFPSLGKLILHYRLRVDASGLAALRKAQLVMETPDRFTVTINGSPVDTSHDCGWWVDVAFRRLDLPPGLFREGDNEILVSCDFSENLNLEALYLLGDFAVKVEGTTPRLSMMPGQFTPSSIVEQGLPFYSGNITYHYDIPEELRGQLAVVSVHAYEGAYLKIGSGNESRIIPWRPNRTRLTLGKVLDVEICITRKNTFGPLHLKDPKPRATGPHSFVPGPDSFSLEPVFIPSGLLAPVELTRCDA
jgi:hypothetical protein